MINSYIDYRGSEGCDRLFERYQFIGPRTYAFHSNLGKLATTNKIYKGPFKQRARTHTHKKKIGVSVSWLYIKHVSPDHYENMPIQIYWTFYHQKMKIFR